MQVGVMRSLIILGVVSSFVIGCGARYQTVKMTPEIVQRDGRSVFHKPKAEVEKAVVDALESLGIGVAVDKPDVGLVVSKIFTLSETNTSQTNAHEDAWTKDVHANTTTTTVRD